MNTCYRWYHVAVPLFIGAFLCLSSSAEAELKPGNLLLVVNRSVPEGMRIAKYYMEKRLVPGQNLIMIETSKKEEINREEYNKEIAEPVRSFLLKNDPDGSRYLCLVLFYGIPLRVGPQSPGLLDKIRLQELRSQLAGLKKKEQAKEGRTPKETKDLREDITRIQDEIRLVSKSRQVASVDSEIALVMEKEYPLEGWLPNKYFLGFRGKKVTGMPRTALGVCRLDGPADKTVYRIIDDSIWAENHGLTGKAYFDMRWPEKGGQNLSAYQIYDQAIRNTARIVERSGKVQVVLDEREALFGPGEATDAALYCGWYSLTKYVDAFTWARGSVGFHVASGECTTLKAAASNVWCKKMLEKGVAATLGPVAEPYLQSFPEPEVFFGCLLKGGTLAECYVVSNPFWSWQMVLIGDPLYRPFRPVSEKRQP